MLETIVAKQKEWIFNEMIQRIEYLPRSPYREFARTKEGWQRIKIWIDNAIQAMSGQAEVFLEDAAEMGYLRAHQGYRLGFIFGFYRIFKQLVWELVEEKIRTNQNQSHDILLELHQLDETLYRGLDKVTASYMKTREEIIATKISQLQALTGSMMEIQEEERSRLAGDIHDTITQSLTGIGYKIQVCQETIKSNPDDIQQQLDELLDMVHNSINISRDMISDLRPDLIDNLGLVAALKKHFHHFEMEKGLRIRYKLNENLSMPPQVKICLFRTVQEGLMNVFKHANKDSAEINLIRTKEGIRLEISDEGCGFNQQKLLNNSGMGLMMMRERVENVGGDFSIDSEPGRGCRLVVTIPLAG